MFTRKWVSGSAYVLIVLAALVMAGGQAFAILPSIDTWLGVEVMQVKGNPAADSKDSFIISGVFNVEPYTLDPLTSDVTLTIDAWSVTIPAASWVQKKAGKPFTAKVGNVSGQINYWVGGSSKCTYRFTATKQDLVHFVPNWPDLPVRLQIGAGFDETSVAGLDDVGYKGKLSARGPKPVVFPMKIEIKMSTQPGKDAIAATGYIDMDVEGVDLSTLGIRFGVQGQTVTISPGDIPEPKGSKIVIKKSLGGTKKLSLTLDVNTGKVTILLTGLDLPGIDTPTIFFFELTNLPDGYWGGKIWMAPDAKMVKYLY